MYVALVGNESAYDAPFFRMAHDDVSGGLSRRRGDACGNSLRKVNLESDHLLTPTQLWLTLDYQTITNANHRAAVEWTVERDGAGHGFVVWFESDLFDDVHISNRPGADNLIYGQMFFPWPEPVPLCAGDTVAIELAARLMNDDYIWSWNSRIGKSRESGARTIEFRQSTFQGLVLSPEVLARSRLDAVPVLLPQAQAIQSALGTMDGATRLQDIAAKLMAEQPGQFPDVSQAVAFLCSLYGRYWR